MKQTLKTILALVCIFSLILASAETPDGGMNAAWSLGCLAVSAAALILVQKIDTRRED